MSLPKTIIHLLSGGLDSTVLLYDLHTQGHSIHCLLFNYGQKHSQELNWARSHCDRLGVEYSTIHLPPLSGSSLTDGKANSPVVPFRNAVLIGHAINTAVTAKADTVTIGCNADDAANFPDCRAEFLQAINAAVKASGYSIEVCAPYLNRAKWWIARLGSDLSVRMDETWSCYAGGAEPCNACPACQKRLAAFNA